MLSESLKLNSKALNLLLTYRKSVINFHLLFHSRDRHPNQFFFITLQPSRFLLGSCMAKRSTPEVTNPSAQ